MKATSSGIYPAGAAIGAALVGLLYAVAFVVLRNALLASLALTLGGLLSLVALCALFARLRVEGSYAPTLGLILAAAGALGSAVHGAYDLANVLNPPPAGNLAALADLPSQVDPRGFLTFGVAGLAILVAARLMTRPGRDVFPGGFAALSYVLGTLMIVVYLARLIILSPANPLVLGGAALLGFIINPAWYIWLGILLRRDVAADGLLSPAPATSRP